MLCIFFEAAKIILFIDYDVNIKKIRKYRDMF
jgi:hypothetical protein